MRDQISRESRVPYVPEHELQKHGIDKIGVVVLIIREADGLAYFVEEEDHRSSTGKAKGVINPPCETRKATRGDCRELIAGNIQALLATELGITDGYPDRNKFIYTDQSSYRGRFPFPTETSHIVHADVVMVRYTGEKELFLPLNEVKPVGFIPIDEALYFSTLRLGVREILEQANEEHWIQNFQTRKGNSRGRLIFPEEFSISLFLSERENPARKDVGE